MPTYTIETRYSEPRSATVETSHTRAPTVARTGYTRAAYTVETGYGGATPAPTGNLLVTADGDFLVTADGDNLIWS